MGSPSKRISPDAGLDQPGDHLHGGGFAGAVRPQVAGDFAGARGEADVVHGGDAGNRLVTPRSSSMRPDPM